MVVDIPTRSLAASRLYRWKSRLLSPIPPRRRCTPHPDQTFAMSGSRAQLCISVRPLSTVCRSRQTGWSKQGEIMLGLATIRKQFRALFATEQHAQDNYQSILIEINKRRSELESSSDQELDAAEWDGTVVGAFALASEVGRRVLGLRMFDEQLLGA